MSGYSSVGNSAVYEAGDQRNVKNSEIETADRYNEGNVNSHQANDSSMFSKLWLRETCVLMYSQRISDPLPTA